MHSEVPIKVNAWVDAGVAPLIVALNKFENIQTLDSCQGEENTSPYVYFVHREGAQQTTAFVHRVAALLASRLDSCCDYSLRLEWKGSAERPLAEIIARREYVGILADALVGIATSCDHTSLSDDGK